MTPFEKEVQDRINRNMTDIAIQEQAGQFVLASIESKYSYNFSWLGRPIIQTPQDIVAMQEIIWKVKPDLIIETGIAHGGSLIFYAAMLELNASCGGPKNAKVLGVDIDIRALNKSAIQAHPMSKRIEMIQASSIAPETITMVQEGLS
jgi:cephalosporin hydroxylase